MNARALFYYLGFFLCGSAVTFVPSAVISIVFKDGAFGAFAMAALIALIIGITFVILFRNSDHRFKGAKETYLFVALAWIVFSLIGSLPYQFLSQNALGFTDAFFETVSGFTTTGSTVIQNIPMMPKSLLFWRAMTHWLGGMGIIVLTLAILPMLGIGGMQMYGAEAPGPISDKVTPRLSSTAKLLWGVYLLFTVVEFILLTVGGMSPFEAITHTFATLATGGFSTENASIAAYSSSYIHYVIIVFMFLAGSNFSLHYFFLRGKFNAHLKNEEFRTYLLLIFSAALFIFFNLKGHYHDPFIKLRDTLFQTLSIMTTTGFCSADFDQWPDFSRMILVTLMFIGGCGGSTGGGMKVVRILIIVKLIFLQIRKILFPNQVRVIRVGETVISKGIVSSVTGFFFIYVMIFFISFFFISFMGYDLITGFTSVAATLNNIGPGLAGVGATQNYAHFILPAKWVFIFCMLAGRLEIVAMIILIYPGTWKRV